LDGIGIQAHLDLAKGGIDQPKLSRFFADIAALGLEIVVTELDVRERDLHAPLPLRDARVAAEVKAYLAVALDQPAVTGVVTWGLTDRDSWLQKPGMRVVSTERALNRGLPYDAALGRKPMYWSIHKAFLEGRPASA
jgi:endo-1,4-beta-xylanase